MSLKSPTQLLNQFYFFLDDLMKALQEHANNEDYVIIKKTTKKNLKIDQIDICYFVCDRERKIHVFKSQKRIHEESQINDCSFSVVVK